MKKNILYFSFMAIVLNLHSCKKPLSSTLAGNWYVTNETVTVTNSVNSQVQYNTGSGGHYYFNADGSGATTENSSMGTPDAFHWVATEKQITMRDSLRVYIYTIVKNEDSKIKWTFDFTETQKDAFFGEIKRHIVGYQELER